MQSTEWSLHPHLFKQICQKWFTPHVDLFATHLNHKLRTTTGISTVHVSSPRPKGLGHRCSELRLDGSHCLCLPSDGSPSQGDPKNQAMTLPDHLNSPRLARDALVWGPSAALRSHNNFRCQRLFSNSPTIMCCTAIHNVHTWCLGVDSSKNKASLWRWQRELLPLRGHQQGPSTSQSGPYLRNGAEKIRWISPLYL